MFNAVMHTASAYLNLDRTRPDRDIPITQFTLYVTIRMWKCLMSAAADIPHVFILSLVHFLSFSLMPSYFVKCYHVDLYLCAWAVTLYF
jgi:hypothetical protein